MKVKGVELEEHENVRSVIFPKVMSKKLAEDVGLQIGDGCISTKSDSKYSYYLYKLAGDPLNEKIFYDKVVAPIKNNLFQINNLNHFVGSVY